METTEKTVEFTMSEMKSLIHDRYEALNGAKGILGSPLSNEDKLPGGLGSFQQFENGAIFAHPSMGAREHVYRRDIDSPFSEPYFLKLLAERIDGYSKETEEEERHGAVNHKRWGKIIVGGVGGYYRPELILAPDQGYCNALTQSTFTTITLICSVQSSFAKVALNLVVLSSDYSERVALLYWAPGPETVHNYHLLGSNSLELQ